jgi:sphinganine C4-monooxygenase
MSAILSLIPQQDFNTSLVSLITPASLQPPFYHNTRPSLLSFVGDKYLSLAAPVIAYWGLSLVFHILDTTNLSYFEKYRIHESPEVLSRNKASLFEVFWSVIFQQVVQTIFGLLYLEDDETILKREIRRDHLADMASLAPNIANLVMLALGRRTGEDVLKRHGEDLVRWMYWWGIPAAQILFAL